jgi:hypothetical protein
MDRPSVGRIVHYVSYGTPGGEYPKACRAAVVSEVGPAGARVGLTVLNPSGLFFHPFTDGGVEYDAGGEHPGSGDCPNPEAHGSPLRYCACGWAEAGHRGGTWHWPERV